MTRDPATRGMTATGAPPHTLRRIVELAQRAPSIHNTQPWRWIGHDGVLELHADRSRQLPVGDPEGRNLVISCGTVLHHAQVVARALGWTPVVARHPDHDRPDLLARIEHHPSTPPARALELLDAVDRRCTDRRRFTSWPVPEERLTHLAAEATAWSSRALPLTEASERFRAELLINRAHFRQEHDRSLQAEQQAWVDHGPADGVPYTVLPAPVPAPRHPDRFSSGLLQDLGDPEIERSDGMIVICDPDDDPRAWLRAGEALSAMWLAATTDGLSLVPLSQVIELPETRSDLRREILGGLAHPLVVVRIGWQPISRRELPRTPRRPVSEVLHLD